MISSEPISEASSIAAEPALAPSSKGEAANGEATNGENEIQRTTNQEPRTKSSRRMAILLGLVLAGVVVAVFYPTLGYKLLTWDDDQHITENRYFNPLTWMNVLHFWGYSHIYLYIPVSYNFYAFEVWIAGWFPSADPADKFNPAVFHAGNLLLHLGCTLWAYRLMLRFVRYAPAALCGAALFAVHPLQAESVCWVGETRGTLATFFSFAAIWFYLNRVGVDPEAGIFAARPYTPPTTRTRDAVFAFLLYGLALLSKPSASSLPLLVFVIDVVLLRHSWKQSLLRLAPWFVAGAVIMGLTKYYQHNDMIYWASIKPWYQRPFVAGDAYAFYLGKLLWPFDLGFDYGRTPHYAGESRMFYRAWLAPLLLVVASIALPRRRIWLGAYGLFLVALLPVSGIVPFIYQSISTVADRYMYVPMFGLGLLLAAWIASRRSPVVPMAVTALVLGFFAQRTIEQCETWRDDWALYTNGLRVNPASYMSHLNLGNRYKDAGHYETAIEQYRGVLAIRYDYAWAYLHMGTCYAKLENYEQAIKQLDTAIRQDPKFVEAQIALGEVYLIQGREEDAEKWFREALKSAPDESNPNLKLGEFLLDKSRKTADGSSKASYLQEGKQDFEAGLKIAPDAESHRRYGRALVGAGEFAAGTVQLEKAVELSPDNAKALADLGSSYLSAGKIALAVEMSERAVRSDPNSVDARANRALALAAAGKTHAARVEYERALKLLSPGSARAAEIRKAMQELK
ncbi:MAG: tetratricopeptide repeat protein [Planctomycetia bacterium]|nr:tetratricopeptide repeat protein [Planctomycetia bacterium]